MYQSGRAGNEAKKRKSPAKSERVGIYDIPSKFPGEWAHFGACVHNEISYSLLHTNSRVR